MVGTEPDLSSVRGHGRAKHGRRTKPGGGSVSNKTIGFMLEKASVDRLFDERGFLRRSTCNPGGDRKPRAVCNGHDLGLLPALGLPDGEPPLLAPAKVPSMKASLMSIPPRS